MTAEELFQEFDEVAQGERTRVVLHAALLIAQAAVGPKGHPLLQSDVIDLLVKTGYQEAANA